MNIKLLFNYIILNIILKLILSLQYNNIIYSLYNQYNNEANSFLINIINIKQNIWLLFPLLYNNIQYLNNYYIINNNENSIKYFIYNNCQEFHDNIHNNNMNIHCLNNINYNYNDYVNYIHKEYERNKDNFPVGIRIYDNNGMILYNTEILRLKYSFFYVRNEYNSISEDMIEMFIQSGL